MTTMQTGAGFGSRPLFAAQQLEGVLITSTQKNALVAGASTLSVAALIVIKMVALDWVTDKLQSRFGQKTGS